jgi:hypothetical protein
MVNFTGFLTPFHPALDSESAHEYMRSNGGTERERGHDNNNRIGNEGFNIIGLIDCV